LNASVVDEIEGDDHFAISGFEISMRFQITKRGFAMRKLATSDSQASTGRTHDTKLATGPVVIDGDVI
jgi:hypothetical protein